MIARGGVKKIRISQNPRQCTGRYAGDSGTYVFRRNCSAFTSFFRHLSIGMPFAL